MFISKSIINAKNVKERRARTKECQSSNTLPILNQNVKSWFKSQKC